jgi:outer membrane protein insertion porin family
MLRTLAITLLVLAYSAPLAIGQISFNGTSGSTIEYSNPKNYTIGGITVEGVRHLDANAIVLLSGLSVGDKLDVPGERISGAIKSLWKQQLFGVTKTLKLSGV